MENLGERLLRVLVVDDNPVHRLLLQELITELGGGVQLASDGQEAIEFGSLMSFDLILMDLAMQGVSGEIATQELRSRGVRCPIIAVTSHVPRSYRREFPQYGFDGLIEKPFAIGTIASALQAAGAFAASGERPASALAADDERLRAPARGVR